MEAKLGTKGMDWREENRDRDRIKRVTSLITYSMMYKIDKYRVKHNMPTVSTAVYELLEKGLETEQ